MKKIAMMLILATGSMFAMNQVSAGQYTIQLEASTSPDLNRYAHLGEYGDLYNSKVGKNLVRTRLGPFVDKHVALGVLEEVQTAGHADAFITRYLGDGAVMPNESTNMKNTASTITRKRNSIENFDVKTLKEWKLLTTEQQSNLVYLDGSLHVKNGSDFTPLYEVIRKNK